MAGRTGTPLRMGRIYLSFLAVLLSCALMLHAVYIIRSAGKMKEEVRQEREHLLSLEILQVSRYLQEIEDLENTLCLSARLQPLLLMRSGIDYLDYADCRDLLNEYGMGPYGIYAIDLYVLETRTLLTSAQGVFYHLDEREGAVYEELLSLREERWTDAYQGREPSLVSRVRSTCYLTHVRPVKSMYTGKVKALLLVSVPYSQFEEYTGIAPEGEYSAIFFGEKRIAGSLPEGQSFHSITGDVGERGLRIVYSYRYNWRNLFSPGFLLFIGAVMLLFLLGLALIVLISERSIARPVERLLHGFRAVEEGRFTERIPQTRDPVMGDLALGFNHMAEHLDRTLTELVDERTRAKELETRLLMMQIRPHFLYNIFNNMIWLTEQKKYEPLEELVEATAGYYRTALNAGEKDILLLENEQQLSCYVTIQKMRFGDRFDLVMKVSDEAQTCQIPNMILQPLVENAIVHGFSHLERRGRIDLTAKVSDGRVRIAVRDNGCGIGLELLEEIRQDMEQAEGSSRRFFALVNVRLQLKLRYGDRAEMRIESRPGEGTDVFLTLPMEENG